MKKSYQKVTVFSSEKPGEKERFLELLKRFDQLAEDGFLKDEKTGRIFVVRDSSQHKRLSDSIPSSKNQVFPLGPIQLEDKVFEQYKVHPAFFEA